jgi:hypothetical protein
MARKQLLAKDPHMMPSEELKKTCPSCFMQIDVRARKCPYCHALQGARRLAAIGAIVLSVVLAFVLLGSLVWCDYWAYRRTGYSGPDRSGDIQIVQSQLYFVPQQGGHAASVVGILRNNAATPVDDVQMEVQVFGDGSKLIDSFQGRYAGHAEPGEEVSFKVSDYWNIHLPESEYKSHRVLVREARQR